MTVAIRTCARCSAELPDGALFCHRCGATTPTTFTGAPNMATRDAADTAAERATNQRLQAVLGSSYTVGHRIGIGGFAEVFSAYDTRLKRDVAVKILRVELAGSTTFVERFRREAESVARLRHPHIVPIYAVGEEQGTAFFVMPRINGATLAEAFDTGQHWGFAEVCRILREASSALAEAHRTGVIHRDVKPENIMLDGPERRVVMMDFGIAKLADPASPSLTATGMMIGSPQYMSPEQAVGEPIDHLSDQYSLALIGYRMLADRLPFDANSTRGLLFQQATQAPPRLAELRPDIPSTLAGVIERAMSKDREGRFASMSEFGDALGGVAREVAGEFRQRRVVAPLAERWATALATLYERPRIHATLATIALGVFIFAHPRGESAAARASVGVRDSAVASARAVMREFGAKGDYAERVEFHDSRTPYQFVQSALPSDSAERVARSLAVWVWDLTWYRGDPEDMWWASANGLGHVMSFYHVLPDSVRRPTISSDSARGLALHVLERLGWNTRDLQLVRQWTYANPNRLQQAFVWSDAGTTVRRARDSASMEIQVAMVGSEAVSYRESFRLPDGYVPDWRHANRQALSSVGMTVLLALFIAASIIAWRRASRDAIQWGVGIRMGAATGVLWLAAITLPRLRALTVPFTTGDVNRVATGMSSLVNSLLNQDMVGTMFLVALLFVAAESMLAERRPDLMAGVSDVSRGRLAVPEVVSARPAGYAYGLAMAALLSLIHVVQWRVLGVAAEASLFVGDDTFAYSMPALGTLELVQLAMLSTAVIMFLIAAGLHWRRVWLAPIASAIIWFCFGFASTQSSPAHIAVGAMLFGVVAWIAWRNGALVALWTLVVASLVPAIADFFWAGGSFVPSGIAGAMLLAAPAAVATFAYRRRPLARPPSVVSTAL